MRRATDSKDTAFRHDKSFNKATVMLINLIRRWNLPCISWDTKKVIYVIFNKNARKSGLDSFYQKKQLRQHY